MKALVYTRPNEVRVLEVEEPDQGAGEAIVQVAVAGICGSELHGIRRPGFRVPPLVMGHEVTGTTGGTAGVWWSIPSSPAGAAICAWPAAPSSAANGR
jgi:threonine dehydrogenase-like Zn-dependent dehydrogenase